MLESMTRERSWRLEESPMPEYGLDAMAEEGEEERAKE